MIEFSILKSLTKVFGKITNDINSCKQMAIFMNRQSFPKSFSKF